MPWSREKPLIGLFSCMILVAGDVIGAGIFNLPGLGCPLRAERPAPAVTELTRTRWPIPPWDRTTCFSGPPQPDYIRGPRLIDHRPRRHPPLDHRLSALPLALPLENIERRKYRYLIVQRFVDAWITFPLLVLISDAHGWSWVEPLGTVSGIGHPGHRFGGSRRLAGGQGLLIHSGSRGAPTLTCGEGSSAATSAARNPAPPGERPQCDADADCRSFVDVC